MGKETSQIIRSIVSAVIIIIMILGLSSPLGPLPPLGDFTNPNGGIWSVSNTAEHPENQTVRIKGLDDTVVVYRDEWGIPHIFAQTDKDMYFALGYVHAQDRLWQLDIQRRFFTGNLSAVMGEDALETDIFYRTIGLQRAAKENFNYIKQNEPNSDLIMSLNAYADGINTYIEKMSPADLPFEFRLINYKPSPWNPWDSLGWGKMMSWNLVGDVDFDLRIAIMKDKLGDDMFNQLFPMNGSTFGMIPVVPEWGNWLDKNASSFISSTPSNSIGEVSNQVLQSIESTLSKIERVRAYDVLGTTFSDYGLAFREILGSNNWVIDGNKSATGYPIIANDMHLSISLPHIWYEVQHASVESGTNVYGFSFIGGPGVIAGHNQYSAWGFTNVGADVTDLYYYKTDPNNPNRYWNSTLSSYQEFRNVTERIKVKGQEDYVLTVQYTGHGPIISEEVHGEDDYTALNPAPLAMRWTGHDTPDYIFRFFQKMYASQNLNDFIEAGKDWVVPGQNTVYADIHGNIAIRPVAKYPIRMKGFWGLVPGNGSSGEDEWLGYIPYDELAVSHNPDQNYLASTNQKTAGPDFSYYMGSFFDDGYRSRRINEFLNGTGTGTDDKFTVDDIKRIQGDNVDTAARALLPTILSIDTQGNSTLQDALNFLDGWNATMLKDLVAPTLWRVWMEHFIDNTFDDEYAAKGATGLSKPQWGSVESFVVNNATVPWFDDISTTGINETIDDIARKALVDAIDELAAEFGSNMSNWLWGEYHQLYADHMAGRDLFSALSAGPYPWDGDGKTLNAAGGPRKVRGGPSERWVVSLDPATRLLPHSWSCIPGGQSGNAQSPHYKDMLEELWLKYKYHTSWYYQTKEEFYTAEQAQADDEFTIGSTLILVPS